VLKVQTRLDRNTSIQRIVNAVGKLNRWKRTYAILVLCAAAAMALSAQTVTTLFSFEPGGGYPYAGLIQATDGDLYGTTYKGGANQRGMVFKITPSGALTTLRSFCAQSGCTDGAHPYAELVEATDGDLYGTTAAGGVGSCGHAGCGTIFKITRRGTLTTLHSFCSQGSPCADGASPLAALAQATNGDLYGTTEGGGANHGGTVFNVTLSGTLTTLYNFCLLLTTCADDGTGPTGGLVQAPDGNFYGTTSGVIGGGTVFEITPTGTLTTLHDFDSQNGDGVVPNAGLVQGTDGSFYGTTFDGGAAGCCRGTVFKITPSGTLTTLHSFCSQGFPCADGANPYAGLVEGTDGNFYGTTTLGGTKESGTVFKITPSGTLTTLYSFGAQSGDGEQPWAALVQATNGDFYGTTQMGGAGGGTVFRLSVGLSPFAKTLPHFGAEGAAIAILGTDLVGTTSVTFNGTPATFTVVSNSLIAATVPAGATTGTVQVVTPGGTLSSNLPFQVLP
jgi:uncharacterized repeat protein (TIGR03803 family)